MQKNMQDKFDNIADLFVFVLEKCAQMKFILVHIDKSVLMYTNHIEPPASNKHFTINKNDKLRLVILKGFNEKYVYMADSLLYQNFEMHLNELRIEDESVTEIEDGYLNNIPVEYLQIPDDCNIPKLPESIEMIKRGESFNENFLKIKYNSDNNYDVIKIITNYRSIHFRFKSKKEAIEAIESGEIEF